MSWKDTLSPRRLQFRIVAVFLGLLVVMQATSLLIIGRGIESSGQASVNAELRTGERVFNRLLELNAVNLSEAARLLAADFGFKTAVASNDGETLVSALANQRERIGAHVAAFTDAQFNLKAATRDGAERFLPALRKQATLPDPVQHIVLLDGEPYQLVVVPVKAPTVIGWIAMAFRIEEPLLREMRQMSSIEVVLASHRGTGENWQVMQSTLGDAATGPFLSSWRAARSESTDGRATRGEGILRLQMPAGVGSPLVGSVLAREIPLGHDGEQRTVAVLMRSLDEATARFNHLQQLLLAFNLVAIAVFGVSSVFTARRVTTPLRGLTESASRLGQGDFGQAVEVKGQDEIADLAQAFETMRLAVREREAQVHRLAYEDSLTGLPNREQFRVNLRDAVERAVAGSTGCAVLMLDLNRFKRVNDELGHRFGDRMLRQVALRLTADGVLRQPLPAAGGEPRRHDVVARLGGDEFAVLLEGADGDTAQAVAHRILRAFEQPILLDDHKIDLGAGIGIACCPLHGKLPDEVMSRAEVAMYAAKQQQAGVLVYSPSLDAGSAESLSLLSELRSAVEQDQLRLYLQPRVDLKTGAVIGAEALVRWQHPERGMVQPMKFIPFAEQTGFVRHLTAWMIDRCAQLMRHYARLGIELKLSVNLSTRDLLDHDLPEKLKKLIDSQGMDPALLCLEITESAIMSDPERALQTLAQLHGLGFHLSIDDFGTGFSSLAYLKSMPVDELKIDKSFVLNMERDARDAKIVRSTIDLAHNLGLSVVAEGVESAKAWKLLQALGCDEGQGFFIAKPMPEAVFANWVSEWRTPLLKSVHIESALVRLDD